MKIVVCPGFNITASSSKMSSSRSKDSVFSRIESSVTGKKHCGSVPFSGKNTSTELISVRSEPTIQKMKDREKFEHLHF